MATTYKIMKTFTRPDGDDIVQYEIVDDNGRKMVAPNWYEHEEEAFAVGQYIEKDGTLYRFTSAHTAEAAWDSSEVTAVSVTGEIESVKSDMNGKASKVSGGTTGNFVSLDANGNIQDSGHKHSDYLTEHQDISDKADKDTDAVEGNFAAFDSNGNPIDSGHKHSDYLTSHQDISGKADKVTGGTADNLAALDASGNLKDSGTSATELKSQIDGKANLIHDTVQNVAIASIPDGASNLPLTALVIKTEPIQTGSGDPSPSNKRPITARTSVNVSRSDADTSNPTVYTVQFGQDVYGANADVINGTGKKIYGIIDLGELTWQYSATNGYFTTAKSGFGMKETTDSFMICDSYNAVANSATHNNNDCWNASTSVRIADSRYTDKNAFKEAVGGVYLCFELAEQIDFTFTGVAISTEQNTGENNIWSDAGDVVLMTYPCDTKLYIDKKFTELQALILENA